MAYVITDLPFLQSHAYGNILYLLNTETDLQRSNSGGLQCCCVIKMPLGHPGGWVVETEFLLQKAEVRSLVGEVSHVSMVQQKKILIFKKVLVKLRVLSQFGNFCW